MSIIEDMKKPTEADIERRHKELWDLAKIVHGESNLVPANEVQDIGEEIRALHCLNIGWDGSGSMRSTLAYYNVQPNIIEKLAGHIEGPLNTERRKDKYAKLISLSKENTYKEFSIKELTDISGLSSSTITTWAKTTGFFQSRERGKWEARNPNDDRRAEG